MFSFSFLAGGFSLPFVSLLFVCVCLEASNQFPFLCVASQDVMNQSTFVDNDVYHYLVIDNDRCIFNKKAYLILVQLDLEGDIDLRQRPTLKFKLAIIGQCPSIGFIRKLVANSQNFSSTLRMFTHT